MRIGADLSQHNGKVDFAKVKAAGHNFVLIREGFGNEIAYPRQKDTFYETNYKAAKAAGLHVGVYHYLYATTAAAARIEAQGFINNLKGKSFDMPIALDIEERSQYNLPNSTVEAIVKAFMDVCEAAGYYCLLYSYEAFLTAKMSASFRNKYDVWCANISKTPNIKYGIHQYTFTGRVNGVSGAVDLNRTDKDYPSIIKASGKNGFKPEQKVLDTSGSKYGDKTEAVYDLKRALMIAHQLNMVAQTVDDNNVFGKGTELAVNSLLRKWGYAENGIAGAEFKRKLFKEILKKL
jgi:GH25 family lysozyme M1 (1,4-beta-N-acetylmuramidase)